MWRVANGLDNAVLYYLLLYLRVAMSDVGGPVDAIQVLDSLGVEHVLENENGEIILNKVRTY